MSYPLARVFFCLDEPCQKWGLEDFQILDIYGADVTRRFVVKSISFGFHSEKEDGRCTIVIMHKDWRIHMESAQSGSLHVVSDGDGYDLVHGLQVTEVRPMYQQDKRAYIEIEFLAEWNAEAALARQQAREVKKSHV